MTAEVRAYNPEFDQAAYRQVSTRFDLDTDREQERLDLHTDKQLQTLLAERYGVLSSRFNYEMVEGQLWGENTNEPAIESFKRGRDYRRVHGNPVDFAREDAEVIGFEKVQEMLVQEKDVLSISPRGAKGSIYEHNFYDVFRWRYGKVEARRYSSALSIEDYKRLLGVDFQTDDEFLSNPIDISHIAGVEGGIHEYLHRDHDYMDEEFFNTRLLVDTYPYRQGYIRALRSGNEQLQALNFNAMLNVADELSERYSYSDSGNIHESIDYSINALIQYGNKEVKEVSAGCGLSGGMKLGGSGLPELSTAPYSVKEFGEKTGECSQCGGPSEDNHYHCPGCGKFYNSELGKSASERTKECKCGFEFGC